MKILIIGGTSSIGLSLKNLLLKNHQVVTVGRKNCDIIFDLLDEKIEPKFPKDIDVVINTVAHFDGTTKQDLLDIQKINVSGTLRLCIAASKSNAKHFIQISSIFALLNPDSKKYSPYSLSKKQSEEIVNLYCKTYSLPFTIIRPSQIYGNFENFNKRQPFLSLILKNVISGKNVDLFGDYDAKFNIIHLKDLTKIIELIINKRILGTFSCSSVSNISYSQFIKTAYSVFNTKGEINFINEKPNISDTIFDLDYSLYEKIGFFPEISLEEGIKEFINL